MYKELMTRKEKGEKLDFAFVGDNALDQLYKVDNCSAEMIADLFNAPLYEVTARLREKSGEAIEAKVEVPERIYDALQQIKENGIDMNDYQAVLEASQSDPAAEEWLRDNMKIYMQSLLYGLKAERPQFK